MRHLARIIRRFNSFTSLLKQNTLHYSTMVNPDQFLPNDTPFRKLDCEVAFQNLTKQERLYAHYLSRAGWEGQFITMFQTSPESPLIFILLDKILRMKCSVQETVSHLQMKYNFTAEETTALLVFAGGFMSNGGNYRGYGDSKFIPNVPVEKLTAVAKELLDANDFEFYMKHCIQPMFDYRENIRLLGFPNNGITTYWSGNCTEDDGKLVTEFLQYKKVEPWNHRVFKTPANTEGVEKDIYEIRFPSSQLTDESDTTPERLIGHQEEYKGKLFRFTRGDYSELIPRVISNLKLAAENALNETQRLMLLDYIKYFETGSIEAHKNGSRHWIKDKGPVVETYIGFIEAYRDPVQQRAEFEAFAAVVNKESSKKLSELVTQAEAIISRTMPWPKEFEKDVYLRPDFTALDIITFSGSGIPIGINIPNYDDITQNEGFKNVHLQNVITAHQSAVKINFLSNEDAELLKKYREAALEVQTALHELLGHGSGKLLQLENGNANFDTEKTLNPLTREKISSYYRDGESFKSVFSEISSSYEECRAECIGFYLCTYRDILKVFKLEGQEADNVIYANWIEAVLDGLKGLEQYNVKLGTWNQAHAQAAFVILRVLLEEAKGLVNLNIVTNNEDGKPDLFVAVNRSEIETMGKKAIGDFLLKLQVYKSTADVKAASKMYSHYSEVTEAAPSGQNFCMIRDIVIDRKRPRPILVQSNTRLTSSSDVDLISYGNSAEDFAKSWIERYPQPNNYYAALENLYKKDMKHFPIK